MNSETHYIELAKACARGMPEKDCRKYFKRYDKKELPRVVKILGMLKNIRPSTLLDVGSGRGRSLWPIVHTLPMSQITCIDPIEWRVQIINAVNRGGNSLVKAHQGDIVKDFKHCDWSFNVVTALEVIEHIPNAQAAVSEMIRLTERFFIASVPSKPDNNPDHKHLFNADSFEKMLNVAEKETGKEIKRIVFDYVPNHMVVFVTLRR